MKNLLIFVSLFSVMNLNAQTWVEDNAVWHYDYWNVAVGGYYIVEHSGDTLIGGEQCEIFQTNRHTYGMTGPNGTIGFLGSQWVSGEIIYGSNDSIHRWDGSQFRLLFDFGAQVNDSWIIDVQPFVIPQIMCDDTSSVVVTGAGIENVLGVDYRYIDLESIPGSFKLLNGRFYERFGGDYFIPQVTDCDSMSVAEFDIVTDLRCFQDDSLSLNFVGQDCNYLATHLGLDSEVDIQITVSPNPTSSTVKIEGGLVYQVDIYSSVGDLMWSVIKEEGVGELDLKELPSGIYHLKIFTGNTVVTKRITKR